MDYVCAGEDASIDLIAFALRCKFRERKGGMKGSNTLGISMVDLDSGMTLGTGGLVD